MKKLILAVICMAAAWSAAAGANASATLADAAQAAGAGRLDEAEALYRSAVASAPAEGWPALARFLRLTGQSTKLDNLILELAGAELPLVAKARTLAAAGREDAATALLRDAGSVNAEAAVALAGLLRRRGDVEAAGAALWAALASAQSAADRGLLFHALRESGALSAGDSPTSLALAADWAVAALEPERPVAIEWFDPLLIELQHHAPRYFEDRERILAAGDAGPGAAWLAARLLTREERHAASWAYLQSREAQWRGANGWPLLAEELAELGRILGRPDDAERYLKLWAQHSGGKGAAQRAWREAELAVARRDWARAMALMAAMDPAPLRPDQQRARRLQWMRAAVEGGGLAQVVDVFEHAAAGAGMEDVEALLKIIFDRWIETERHWAIESAVRDRFARNAAAAPELWLLAAEAAREARLAPNQIEALYQYVHLRPNDLNGLKQLAAAVRPIAEELASVDEKDLAAPAGERERLAHLAEQSLRQLIISLPYEPEHYQALIEFYKAMGREDEARQAPQVVATGTANPHILGVAGYALALSGYPDAAMAYYDRALAIDPEDMQVRMNRAACLTRLDRMDEAAAFYHNLLENGHKGRAYHAHELVGRLWAIAQHEEREAECLAYFDSLPQQIKGDWLGEAMLTAANVAAMSGRLDASRRLIVALEAAGAPDTEVREGWENYAMALVEAERLDEADQVFQQMMRQFGGATETDVMLMHGRAEIQRRQGNARGAVDLLREAARRYPDSPEARDGLFRAGDLAGESGDLATAMELYEAFLDSGSVSFVLRHEAEAKLKALRGAQGGNSGNE